MANVEHSIDVGVPLSTAYNQWTQFEEFPRFMEGVEEVRQLDDAHLHWRTKIAGVAREFDAEITEQTPDQRIAWRSTSGTTNSGVVTFQRLEDAKTRVTVQVESEPEGLVEKAGEALGMLQRRVKGDLERFKELIEGRGTESGAWRGEVRGGEPVSEPTGRFAREEGAREEGVAPPVSETAGTGGGTPPATGAPGAPPTREQGGL